jgi:hypothetical protein
MSLSRTSKDLLNEQVMWEGGDDEDGHKRLPAGSLPEASLDDDEQSSSVNKSTTDTNRTGNADEDLQNIKNSLTQRESQQVFRLRAIVIFILLVVAGSISYVVFNQQRDGQVAQFEAIYYGVAEKLVDSLEGATGAIAALGAFGVMATVESEHQDVLIVANTTSSTSDSEAFSGWPFVKLDAFQERAISVRSVSKSIYVSVNPIVASNELILWENYVQSDVNDWM